MYFGLSSYVLLLLFTCCLVLPVFMYNSVTHSVKNIFKRPQLVLIGGSTCTGKSTLSVSLGYNLGITKCVSTDTIRTIARGYDTSIAVRRSSFEGEQDPVLNWLESCETIEKGIQLLAEDALHKHVSLILEGVLLRPNNDLLDYWRSKGGDAHGILLYIGDKEYHRSLISHRPQSNAVFQADHFTRIRSIHDEMKRLATVHNWCLIDQKDGVSAFDEYIQSKPLLFSPSVMNSSS